jgi:hypothetical protein
MIAMSNKLTYNVDLIVIIHVAYFFPHEEGGTKFGVLTVRCPNNGSFAMTCRLLFRVRLNS